MVYSSDSENPLLPSGRDLGKRTPEGNNDNNGPYKRYILYRDKESFERACDTEAYRQSWNYRSLEPLRASILAKESEYRQRHENEIVEALKQTQSSVGLSIETKLGNCLCKSSWCKKCHKLFYIPKYKEHIQKFDYTKTRHVILTTDRIKFEDGLDALKTITDQKSLSAFIRKLRNGKKIKIGDNWKWLYPPIKIKQALAVLEFYSDGFPHWHLLIEVENEGKPGMIGGENLHRAWKHGIVKETYFRNLDHWKSIAGYFADKGYFEKGKEYQTELPKDIQEHYGRRVRRITYYPGQRAGVYEEEKLDLTEEEAFQEVSNYFEGKKKKLREKQGKEIENKRKVNYKTIISQCGTNTYIRVVIDRILVQMFLPVPFKTIKDLLNPTYTKQHGYVCSLTIEALRLIEANSVRTIKSRETYNQLFDDDDDDLDDLESSFSNAGEPVLTVDKI